MVFKNRADFKQQMALYTLQNKFRSKNARSTRRNGSDMHKYIMQMEDLRNQNKEY